MGFPFTDITLYGPARGEPGTKTYFEDVSLMNFVSDLYVTKMHGYKPPNTSRISIQPGYYGIWEKPHKSGSVALVAEQFDSEVFFKLPKCDKYLYILNVIHAATHTLSAEYKWDIKVFDNAYAEVLQCQFNFIFDSPKKKSKDRKKVAWIRIEKTEFVTTAYCLIDFGNKPIRVKLFEKNNMFWYDIAYVLAKNSKWFDSDKFGINYAKRDVQIWYSISKGTVEIYEEKRKVEELTFSQPTIFGW